MDKKKVIVVGDTHGRWEHFQNLIDAESPDMVIQCGDFGYWPRVDCYNLPEEGFGVPVHFCDGNHEDHWSLQALEDNEIVPGVFYQPRGSILNVEGLNIMFFGGGESIDKANRKFGIDWFPDEVPKMSDFFNLPETRVDVMITHTAPKAFEIPYDAPEKGGDPTRAMLDAIWEKYRPLRWFFGHYHDTTEDDYRGTHWKLLDCIESKFSWCIL